MAYYVNKICSNCGGNIILYNKELICENCKRLYKPVYLIENIKLEEKVCPDCGKTLIKVNDRKFFCASCGYLATKSTYTDQSVPINTNFLSSSTNTLCGWICPRCDEVVSPFNNFCPNCTHQTFEYPSLFDNYVTKNYINKIKNKAGFN